MKDTMMNDEQQPHKTIESALAALQPLRDLAKNWDIDIASCLEDYLNELGNGVDLGTLASQGDETVKPNFAQAALVLHNSSHIYSRKVEYLYNLVYQALDSLSSVNSQQKLNRGRSSDPELDDFRDFDPYQEFLLLDDVLPTDKSDDCRHINLAPTVTDQEVSRRFSITSSVAATPHQNMSMRTQNLSSSTVGRSFHTLSISKALNQINTQSTAVLNLMDGQCDLDPSGRLLVPGCESTPFLDAPPALQAPFVESEQAPRGDYEGDYNDDDDSPGFMMVEDNETTGEAYKAAQDQPAQSARKRVTFAPEKEIPRALEPLRPDPWALLDPHTTNSRKSRPLRLGKSLCLPAGIDDLPSDCVTGSRTRKWKTELETPPAHVNDHRFFTTLTFQALSRKRRHQEEDEGYEDSENIPGSGVLPTVPVKGLLYGQEFAYLAREHAQRKAADRRNRRQILQESRANEASIPSESAHSANYDGRDDDDDDNDYGGGLGFDGGNDDDGYEDYQNLEESPIIETNTGLQTVEEVYRPDDGDNDSVADARAFEELCRAHIARFAKGAEKYASETKLTQRVDKWQAKLEPLLEQEEQRPVFDIHEYGRNVLGSLEGILQAKRSGESQSTLKDEALFVADFGEVTKECPRYQVCRYFLATLSLCNSGNVILEQTKDTTRNLSVKLLSTEINRPMETYLAPSLVE